MAFIRVDDIVIHYRFEGGAAPGPSQAPVIFVNSLGSDLRIWDDVVALLPADRPKLRYDKRGHGLTTATPSPYTIDLHAGDLLGLMDALEIERAAMVGLSVGGVIALSFASLSPARLAALVLADTAAKIGTAESWNERIAAVEEGGIAAISDGVVGRWFTPAFAARNAAAFAGWRTMLERTPVAGYAGTCAALRDADLTEVARRIDVPTLCFVGDGDEATPPDLVQATASLIAGARLAIIEAAGHLPCIEQPAAVAGLISAHLQEAGYA